MERTLSVIVHPKFPMVQQAPVDLLALPQDLLAHIASCIKSPQALLAFEQASKRCKDACQDVHWKDLLRERFGWVPEQAPASWRALYRFQHQFFLKIVMQSATDQLMKMHMGGMAAMPRLPAAAFMHAPVFV